MPPTCPLTVSVQSCSPLALVSPGSTRDATWPGAGGAGARGRTPRRVVRETPNHSTMPRRNPTRAMFLCTPASFGGSHIPSEYTRSASTKHTTPLQATCTAVVKMRPYRSISKCCTMAAAKTYNPSTATTNLDG
eukprot:60650-Prymnesium_polylepis.1